MKVTVFGSGYVGLVTAACLAEVGNQVVCMDIDQEKIAKLRQGIIPIYEPGLSSLVKDNLQARRLHFTCSVSEAVEHGLCLFIAVGTPPNEDGSADLQYVLDVAQNIAANMQDYKVVINKSTVPVGTADKVSETIQNGLAQRQLQVGFNVISNPEFLKEGSALNDFMKPDRIVIGSNNQQASEILKDLYAPFNRNHDRIIVMDVRSAELTKYAANAMLATKISFMNELANLADLLGADIEQVRHGIGSDNRIGYHFIYPGCGYGGSCFPKDVKALKITAQEQNYLAELLNAVENVNNRQKQVLFNKILQHYQGNIANKTFALWGLAFKPKTDDMREAPSRVLIEALLKHGAIVKAFDPEAMHEAKKIYPNEPNLIFCDSQEQTLDNANALCVVTEWKNFWSPDFSSLVKQLADKVIFDGRNLYNPMALKKLGIRYYGIGRGNSEDKA